MYKTEYKKSERDVLGMDMLYNPGIEENKMKRGDLVVLNSGGPEMVIVSVDKTDDTYLCAWMNDSTELDRYWFPGVCIKLIDNSD